MFYYSPEFESVRWSGETHITVPSTVGLASNGGVIEVLIDAAGATWSIIITMPDGMACMIAVGEHWEPLSAIKAGTRT